MLARLLTANHGKFGYRFIRAKGKVRKTPGNGRDSEGGVPSARDFIFYLITFSVWGLIETSGPLTPEDIRLDAG